MTTARIHGKEIALPNVVIEGNTARIVRGSSGPIQALAAGPAQAEKSPFDSKLEASYDCVCRAMVQAGEVQRYWHHPFSLKLPGEKNRYTPDFLLWMTDWTLQIREVKGWSKNRREGITKLKTAAGHFPWATYYLITKEDGHWSETLIRPE